MENIEWEYVKENGMTFIVIGQGLLERCHDDKFNGMRFTFRRCPFCQRITSIAPLHWYNHLNKCAPNKYSKSDIFKMRYSELKDINFNLFIGRQTENDGVSFKSPSDEDYKQWNSI